MNREELIHLLALIKTPLVGHATARQLISVLGSARNVFKEKHAHLVKIEDIGDTIARSIKSFTDFDECEQEINFAEKNHIQIITFQDEQYPFRLKQLNDAPLVLFVKGNISLNNLRMLAMVGTRNASEYGIEMCEKLCEGLQAYGVTTVSGLAYGIDYHTHKASLKFQLPTIAVLGHGLDRVYPYLHKPLANEIIEKGALVTEFFSRTIPSRENFPKRNRIIAGLTDGIVVVETARKGGAIITAEIAFSYNREVMAVPGKTTDTYSSGCNYLIKTQKASLIENAEDIAFLMGWDKITTSPEKPGIKLENLDPDQQLILKTLKSKGKLHIDALASLSSMMSSVLSVKLLELEFMGLVKALPGNFYKTTF